MTDLMFTITDDISDGRTIKSGVFSRDWEEEQEMDDLAERVEAEEISVEQAIAEGNALLKKYPDNIELYSFLGNRYWEAEMKDEAGEIYEIGYHKAASLIPKTFRGRIDWYRTDNRSFLRVAHGYLLSLMHKRDGRRAMALANKLMKWCPADNLGVRFLRGDIKMISEDRKGALKAYLKEAEHSPVSWYAAALISFRTEDYVRACTYLRKGIAGNPYVAEALTGRTLLADHLYWHGGNLHNCEFALDYLQSAGNDWNTRECDFVDLIFNSSDVLNERAELMEIHEALTEENDPERRSSWVARSFSFIESIDDQLSLKIVRKIHNRWGDEIWPWDREGRRHPATSPRGRKRKIENSRPAKG